MNKQTKITKPLRIALVGGGTAGPIVPLLAMRQFIIDSGHYPQAHFLVIDVRGSVGQALARHHKLAFARLFTGKLRRYFSLRNVGAPFLVAFGFFQALYILRKHKTTHVIGGGGFVEVPVIWAAWLLRLRRHIHQQDVVLTLANGLAAPAAQTISVTFESSLRDFAGSSGMFAGEVGKKISWTGNPCRPELAQASRTEAQHFFHLDKSWPTVYIFKLMD